MKGKALIRERFPKLDERTLDELAGGDPSGRGKYVMWMAKQLPTPAPLWEIIQVVQAFHAAQQRLAKDRRDLYRYRSLKDVQRELAKLDTESNTRRKKTRKGYSVVRRLPRATVYRVETYEGAAALSRDTKWCLAERAHWGAYEDAVILVVVTKGKKRRAKFSKFALISESRGARGALLSRWNRIRRMARDAETELEMIVVYDERNDSLSLEPALVALLDHALGGGVFKDLVTYIEREQHKINALWIDVLRRLSCGRALKSDEFNEIADCVAREALFNVVSLFDHPKASVKKCREHLWDLASTNDDLGAHDIDIDVLRFMARTRAPNIPEVMERCLKRIRAGAHKTRNGKPSHALAKSLLRSLSNNERLTPQAEAMFESITAATRRAVLKKTTRGRKKTARRRRRI